MERKLNKKKLFCLFILIVLVLVIVICFLNKKYNNSKKIDIVKEKVLESKEIYYNPEYNSEYITKINNINILNDKINNKYQFVFISDLQASIIDEKLEDERLKQSLIERHEEFVNQNTNQIGQEEIFDEIVQYTNNMNADALLLGGDIIDCPAESNFNLLERELNKNLKVRYLYTLGNHDWTFSWDYQSKDTEKKYYPRFKKFMDDLQVSYLEYEDLIILAINDGKEQFEKESIDKIKKVLNKQKPTIVMMHIPFSTKWISEEALRVRNRVSTIGEYGIKPDKNTQKVMDLILSEEYNVFYILSGHIHYALKDNLNEKIIEEVSAPAFTGAINVIKINNEEEEK